VREVDAAGIARETLARIGGKPVHTGDAIAAALRRERIAALRRQMR
jgi:hypothetical protein